jgi:hypothetical protein
MAAQRAVRSNRSVLRDANDARSKQADGDKCSQTYLFNGYSGSLAVLSDGPATNHFIPLSEPTVQSDNSEKQTCKTAAESCVPKSFLSGWWQCVSSSLGRDSPAMLRRFSSSMTSWPTVAGVWIQADDNPLAPGAPHTVGAAAGPDVRASRRTTWITATEDPFLR